MTENQNQQPKVFCTAPFFHFYYKGDKTDTKLLPCCEARVDGKTDQSFDAYWNGEFLKSVRQAMLNNQAHDMCTRCINVESNGGFSAREHYKNLVKRIEDKTQTTLYYDLNGTQFNSPLAIDYRGSNLCNLKCRMCHPSSSSEIAKEMVKHEKEYAPFKLGNAKNKLYKDNKLPNEFIETLPLDEVRRMKVLGGEPLMQEDVYIALEKLSNLPHHKDITVSFTTNATNFPDRFIDLVSKFDKLLVRVSLDGVDSVHDYIRTNGNWNKILDNCKKLNTYGFTHNDISLGFSFVVQFYNIFRIKEILEFVAKWEEQKYAIWNMSPFFSTIEQDWLSTALLTDEDRQWVNQQIDDFDSKYPNKPYTKSVRKIVNDFDVKRDINQEHAMEQMKNYTYMQDTIRKTNVKFLHEKYGKYL